MRKFIVLLNALAAGWGLYRLGEGESVSDWTLTITVLNCFIVVAYVVAYMREADED